MPVKIAMIGAGSIGFTRRLMRDIVAVPELSDTVFASPTSRSATWTWSRSCAAAIWRPTGCLRKLISTLDRRAAIADCDYIVSMIRQGGLEAFQLDIDIPLKYGVDQCVGDTLCAGGIMYAQRTIPALLGFCKDIREVAKPGAIFLNYSNPMAMNTWACNKYGGVKTIGLCHGVQGAHWQITRVHRAVGEEGGADRSRRDAAPQGSGCHRGGPEPPDVVHQGAVAGDGYDPALAGAVRGASRIRQD